MQFKPNTVQMCEWMTHFDPFSLKLPENKKATNIKCQVIIIINVKSRMLDKFLGQF